MTSQELQKQVETFAKMHNVSVENCRPITKRELRNGVIYHGICRNTDVARWDSDEFLYFREKFKMIYTYSIKHFEDDDGYDVFIPIEVKCL